ncbi:MAG TPA: hypothetical protein VH575_23735 [Gemmataceae bacterium]|jgi:hypothetical protein
MTTQTTATSWIGWYRPRKQHPWERLTEGDDYGQVLNDLLDVVADRPRGGEMLVSQVDPNVGAATSVSRPRRCY